MVHSEACQSKSELFQWIATQLCDPEQILQQVRATRKCKRSASLMAETKTAWVTPRTEIERTIAAVWQEVLNIDQVGLYDNFFDLGGHSLLMVQVNSQLQAIFGKSMPLLEMLNHPTVGALAAYFSRDKPESSLAPEHEARIEQLEKGQQRLRQRLRQRQQAAESDD